MSDERRPPLGVSVWNEDNGFRYCEILCLFIRLRVRNFGNGGHQFIAELDLLPYSVAAGDFEVEVPGKIIKWWKSPQVQRNVIEVIHKNALDISTRGCFILDGNGDVKKVKDLRTGKVTDP